jgi:hypothetical protein
MARSTNWCFTINNYTELNYEKCFESNAKFLVVGKEIGESGTPHLQGFAVFESKKSLAQVKEQFGDSAHCEICKGTVEQNVLYCTKDGDFREQGTRPISNKRKGELEKERWEHAKQLALEGKIDEIEGNIYLRCYSALKQVARDHLPIAVDLPPGTICGVWIMGLSGCGKSTYARSTYTPHFCKPMNKWWDGYDNEPNVILDDIDPTHSEWIRHFLKIWTDRYAFIGEKKGTSLSIRPIKLVVTSQYSIGEVFKDAETAAAITRRCEIVNFFAAPPVFNEMNV